MNREHEATLAWSLATAAAPVLRKDQYSWLCVTLGAGDYTDGIEALLNVFATHGVNVPSDLRSVVLDWLAGYRGSIDETRLQSLVQDAGVLSPQIAMQMKIIEQSEETPEQPARYAYRGARVTSGAASVRLSSRC